LIKRKTYILICTALVLIIFTTACYQEIILPDEPLEVLPMEVIAFDGISAFTDTTDGFMLFTLSSTMQSQFAPLVTFEHHEELLLNGKKIVNGEVYKFGPVEVNNPYQLVAIKGETRDTFKLIFTSLPVIRISTQHTIPDEPKVPSSFEMQFVDDYSLDPHTCFFESIAGIEIRGKTSARYDKKSFGIELWNSRYGEDRAASLLKMRFGEDWILDAMYIDALRVRNKVSFELWNQMTHSPARDGMNEVKTGINMEYVELFINNRYNGLYCLGEKMNEQLIGFSPKDEDKGAVLYKTIAWDEGSTTFETYSSEPPASLIWSGWEQIYPKTWYNWEPLAELRKTVVLEEDEIFESKIGTLIDLENAADYYLFINIIMGYDNVGKNIYYTRYSDQSKFVIIPWDVEATWGKMYHMGNSHTIGILGNHLFDRLIDLNVGGFSDSVKIKWHTYRRSIFHSDSLVAPVSRYYQEIGQSGAIERENARWSDIKIDYEMEYTYLLNWMEGRLKYLDNHFE
jgi:spore coat protein H